MSQLKISLVLMFLFHAIFVFSQESKLYSDSINVGEYSLKIVSYYLQGSVQSDQKHFFPSICVEQTLFFLKNNIVSKKCNYQVKKVAQMVESGQKIKMLENVIVEIGVVEGKYGSVFVIGGYGGCNSCSELDGVFSMKGEKLYLLYRERNIEFENFGNLDSISLKYGFMQDDYWSRNYRKKWIQKNW